MSMSDAPVPPRSGAASAWNPSAASARSRSAGSRTVSDGPVPRGHRGWRARVPEVAAVAVGGAVGACARHGASLLWPTAASGFPWSTVTVNVVGCAAMGVLVVLTGDRGPRRAARPPHRLLRPFLGTGVLGGFTTFSAYAVETRRLLTAGHLGAGVTYLGVTLLGALLAVWAAARLTRWWLRRRDGARRSGRRGARRRAVRQSCGGRRSGRRRGGRA